MATPSLENDLKSAQDSLEAAKTRLFDKWAATVGEDDSFEFTFGDPSSTPYALKVTIYYDENGETVTLVTQPGVDEGIYGEESRISEGEETEILGVIEDVLPLLDDNIPGFAQAIYSLLLGFEDHSSFKDPDFEEVEHLKELTKKLRQDIAAAKKLGEAQQTKMPRVKARPVNERSRRDEERMTQLETWLNAKLAFERAAQKKQSDWYSRRVVLEWETLLPTRMTTILFTIRQNDFDSPHASQRYLKLANELFPQICKWLPFFDNRRAKFESSISTSPNPSAQLFGQDETELISDLGIENDMKLISLTPTGDSPTDGSGTAGGTPGTPSNTTTTTLDNPTRKPVTDSPPAAAAAASKKSTPFPPPGIDLFDAYDELWSYAERVVAIEQPSFLFSRNQVTFVPRPILSILRHITELNLSENKLSNLPVSIRSMKCLKRLILHSNCLTRLPHLLDGDGPALPDLEFLDIHNNKLTALPIGIGQCEKLQSLDAEKNRISNMDEICTAGKLNFVNLSDNQIKLVPATLVSLTNLQYLKLKNNPIVNLPPHIYIQGMAAIITFLQDHTQLDADALPSSLRSDFSKLRDEEIRSGAFSFIDLTLYPGLESDPLAHALSVHSIIVASRLPFIKGKLFARLSSGEPSATSSSPTKLVLDLTSEHLDVLVRYAYTDDYLAPEIPSLDSGAALQELEQAKIESMRLEMVSNWRKTLTDHLELARKFQLRRLEFLVADRLGIAKAAPASVWDRFNEASVAPGGPKPLELQLPTFSSESRISQDLQQLALQSENTKLVTDYDVAFRTTLEPEMPLLRAHKFILCARSPYWRSLLTGGLVESKQEVVELDDISHASLKDLIEFCYTDDVTELNGDTIMELMMKARLFGLDRLVVILESAIGYSLDVSNVASILATAYMYHLPRLAKATKFFVMSHWFQVSRDPSWDELETDLKARLTSIAIKWGIISDPSASSASSAPKTSDSATPTDS